MTWRIFKKIVFFLAAILVFLVWSIFMLAIYGFWHNTPAASPQFGVTFSKKQALLYKLDWRKTYSEVLDNLGVKFIRLPAYWDEIEPEESVFDFQALDWQVKEAGNRGAKVILTVGLRLPRWPECHAPRWVQIQNEFSESLLKYVKAVVGHYKDFENVVAWQVENEPFLEGFGECPNLDKKLLDREIALVKSLDSRPVIVTDSGELGDWFRSYRRADIFGTTMYRKIWNPKLGFWNYPLPPAFFWLRQGAANFFFGKKPVIGVELQAEPWGPIQAYDMGALEAKNFFSLREMLEHVDYSRRVGLPQNFLWGVEWWAWMKNAGHPQYWNLAKTVF